MKIVFISFFKRKDRQSLQDEVAYVKPYYIILEKLAESHTVTSIANNTIAATYLHNKVNHERIVDRTSNLLPLFKTYRYIRAQRPDALIIHSLHFPLQVLYARLLLGKKVKLIVQHHAEVPFVGMKRRLLQLAHRFTDAYFFVSKQMAEAWVTQKNITSTKKVVEVMEVSSVFDCMPQKTALEFTKASGTHIFLWVGRLNANKDPVTVIKAFIQFLKETADARLYMIYQKADLLPEINLLLEANSHAKESIVLIGKKDHAEMLYWYNSAHFIVAASHYEGSGTAVCEAMSCGCIPILSNIASFNKMTLNGSCGLLFEQANPQALAASFKKAIAMDRTLARQQTLDVYTQQLSPHAISQNIYRTIQQLKDA